MNRAGVFKREFNRYHHRVIYNGQIFSPEKREECTAVGIIRDRIAVVERDELVLRWGRERGAVRLDLQGKALLPGFIDSHVHLLSTGIEALSPRIYGLGSISSLLELIQGEVQRTPAQAPLSFYSYNDLLLKEKRPPSREELDLVAPHHPIFLSRIDLHSCVLNTKAVERLGVKHPGQGLFLGKEGYNIRRKFLDLYSRQEKTRAIKEAIFRALKAGVTSLHAMEGGFWQGNDAIDIVLELKGQLPLHLILYPMTLDLDFIQERGLTTLGGDLFLDGSIGSRTAALSRDYHDDPGNRGSLYYSTRTLTSTVKKALSLGIKVGFHAIGDVAIEQALQVFEGASSSQEVSPASFRLEHFSLPSKGHIKRARDLGVGIGIQATCSQSLDLMKERLGQERVASLFPHRRMYDAGLLLAAGSDSNVDAVNPLHILASLHRRSFSFEEALCLCTWNGAQLAGEGERRGRIEPGMAADLVVLQKDLADCSPQALESLEIFITIVDGQLVFISQNQ